jgi:hypothetical protein
VALLVCGVVRSRHPDPHGTPAPGDAMANVRLVHCGALAAAVREMPDDAVPCDDDATLYLDALIALLRGGPVLPIRFGTLAPGDEAVRELLDDAAEDLAHRLDVLDGLVEVRLQIAADLDAEIRALVETSPELARVRPKQLDDRVRQGERISAELAERQDGLSEYVLARLQRHAVACRTIRPQAATEVRHAYLICAETLAEFDEAVRDLSDDLGDRYAIEYAGPLPPFEFTDLSYGEHAPARPRWGW